MANRKALVLHGLGRYARVVPCLGMLGSCWGPEISVLFDMRCSPSAKSMF